MSVRSFADYLFERAKRLWWSGLVVKLVVFTLSAFLAFTRTGVWWGLPWLAIALGVVGDTALLMSDRFRSDAETLLRKLDLNESLGWFIERREIADLEARYPTTSPTLADGSNYFASSSTGSQRAFENLRESSWWSKHLSETMFSYGVIALIASGVVTVSALIAAVKLATDPAEADAALLVAKTATTFLMLAFSMGLLKVTLGYQSFKAKCQSIEDRASAALAAAPPAADLTAVKSWNDYHIARASAPMLPTLLWRMQRDRLNAAWLRQFGPSTL